MRPYEPDGLGIDVGDEEIAGGVGEEGLHGGSIRRAVEKRCGLGDEHLVTWTETDDLHWYCPPLSSLGMSKDTCAQQPGEPPPDGDAPGYAAATASGAVAKAAQRPSPVLRKTWP